MRYAFQFKINFTGGIISPGYLLHIIQSLKEAGIDEVRFGLRQQLLIDVQKKNYHRLIDALEKSAIQFEVNKDAFPNIVSSYAAESIFTPDSWLSEGVYKDIFDLFDYLPRLKINISDANQSFTPFFTGHINWVASGSNHFWYLFIRLPKTQEHYQWPELIYTNDIPRLSKQLEHLIIIDKICDGNELHKSVAANIAVISRPVEHPLQLPKFQLPYYEGFNNYGNKSWLGIYRRDELFPVNFLKDIANTCLKTKVGQLYTTPWKSIVIKGIERSDRSLWDHVLGKYRINVRHASNELGWQVEDNNEEGLNIKRHIIRQFDKEDVRTFGLCFAVKTQHRATLYGSVLIERKYGIVRNKPVALDSFNIYYTQNFNPNSSQYILFRESVKKEHLDTYLISVCKYYYEMESTEANDQFVEYTPPVEEEKISEHKVYQCPHCLTVYDEATGDEQQQVTPFTLFAELPETYCCSLCETPKEELVPIERVNIEAVYSTDH
jgi:rubredoxin